MWFVMELIIDAKNKNVNIYIKKLNVLELSIVWCLHLYVKQRSMISV